MSDRSLPLRTVIVEDEPLARENLREYTHGVDWITLIGEASDGTQAVQMIDQLRPDLVFLDVSLPELSGMQVIEQIRHHPEIVFTTAHDKFALAAFETGALDYLLKPFGRKRFEVTLERVRRRLMSNAESSGARARSVRAAAETAVCTHAHRHRADRNARNRPSFGQRRLRGGGLRFGTASVAHGSGGSDVASGPGDVPAHSSLARRERRLD